MEKKHLGNEDNILKVVLFGPESTGKSTLAQQLALHYKTVFVPEYSRIYAEKQLLCGKTLTREDVMAIADGQLKLESELLPKANKILFCDTDLLETKVYSEMYYDGYCPPQLEDFAVTTTCDLYLLTNVDLPWEADAIRDKPDRREEQFLKFETTLKTYGKPYKPITGNETIRLRNAIRYVDELLKNHP
ncbi:MAG TPA: ATP-binding protein [Aquaticitalea sp.]|nr:ATP-binding protein [Aquaticitalea sp.]HNU60335.1 ATP-binding protein [Aquaticitalea sp.]